MEIGAALEPTSHKISAKFFMALRRRGALPSFKTPNEGQLRPLSKPKPSVVHYLFDRFS